MGNFSRNTFDPARRYTSVRLQQGVPLVDADVNEMQDIRQHALEQFLRQFVGDGVPYGDDGFAITLTGAVDDFSIAAGACLAGGLEASNDADTLFSAQELSVRPDLASQWGVPALDGFSITGTHIVYLDTWDREVDSTEDADIVNGLIGIETSVRNRREWVVRVAPGAVLPPVPAGSESHAFYALATLERAADGTLSDLVEQRRTGVRVPSYHDLQQFLADAFGAGYPVNLARGPNPGDAQLATSLREAINALMRGELPTAPAAVVRDAPDSYFGPGSLLRTSNGELYMLSVEFDLVSGQNALYYDRYDEATGRWTAGGLIPTGADLYASDPQDSVSLVELADDRILAVFLATRGGDRVLVRWRFDPSDGSESVQDITSGASDRNPELAVDDAGRVWVFWHRWDGTQNRVFFMLYDQATDTFGPEQSLTLAGSNNEDVAVTPVAGTSQLWVVWTSDRDGNRNIYYDTYDRLSDTWAGNTSLTLDASTDREAQCVEANGELWVFWKSNRTGSYQVFARNYSPATGLWGPERQLTEETRGELDNFSVAATDDGEIWLFWHATDGASFFELSYKRMTADELWGAAKNFASDAFYARVAALRGGNLMVTYAHVVDFNFLAPDLNVNAQALIGQL